MKDRDLVRLYWPVELRPAFDALLDIDEALANVVAKVSEPALAAIKLAWWREALQRLDNGPPPPEPRLKAAVAELLPRGITGGTLARLEDGWAALLDEEPDAERVLGRGEALFDIGGRLLGGSDPMLGEAGRLYGSQACRRRGLAAIATGDMQRLSRHRFPRRLRPLTAFARLAARDARQAPWLEPEGTPGRAAALIANRLTGRIA